MTLGGILGGGLDVNVNLGIFQPIGNLADAIIQQIANFVLGVIAAAVGLELRLTAVVSASVSILPNGKLYRLTVGVLAKINGIWVAQRYECEVFVPFIGPWECRSYKLC